jgi:aminocarboxymuconate-semialdehyde decarboxylase
VKLVGADRVTLGTDYCFDMGLTDPVATVGRIDGLSPEQQTLIKGGTAARLLRLS